jgi:hypothetical protein
MNRHASALIASILLTVIAQFSTLAPLAAGTLENRGLSIGIDDQAGTITSVKNELTSETYAVAEVSPFGLLVDDRPIHAANFELQHATTDNGPQIRFTDGDLEVAIAWRNSPERHFIEKVLRITNNGDSPRRIDRVALLDLRIDPNRLFLHQHEDPSVYRWLINVYLRAEQGGLFAGIENPFSELAKSSGRVELSYRPNWLLAPGEAFECEPAFLGAYRKEHIYAFKELGRLAATVRAGGTPPLTMRMEQEILDWGEIWAMQAYIESIQPPQTYRREGYYLRAIGPIKDVATSKAFVDKIARLGHIPHIEWNTWIRSEQSQAPRRPAIVVTAKDGQPRIEPNPAWVDVANYARNHGIFSGSMEAVPNDFYKARAEWLVRDQDGGPAGDGKRVCLANSDYIEWYINEYVRLVSNYDLYMLAWDSPAWLWNQFPEPSYECHSTAHGHPVGDCRYHVWRNLMRLFSELHRRHPQLAMRIAAGLQPGYPWILKDLIEHHTSFYDHEPGGSWWRSRNLRFIPAYKCGTNMTASTWPQLRYNFFRSLAIADHAMIWGVSIDPKNPHQFDLPTEPEQQEFFRKWLDWADKNIEYLRVRRDLFREPWGDDAINANRVDMEGNFPWPDPQIHGSAHCIADRGFIFLFNPAKMERAAAIPVNHWLGLSDGKRYAIREIFPADDRALGAYNRGDTLVVQLDRGSAMVLAVGPTNDVAVLKDGAVEPESHLPVDKAFLKWEEIPWEEIKIP